VNPDAVQRATLNAERATQALEDFCRSPSMAGWNSSPEAMRARMLDLAKKATNAWHAVGRAKKNA
jgi:hypothetical protein